MQLLDPFVFRDLFPAVQSIAVIGNAPCILDWKHGAKIDSYDLVVRFNRAQTEGFEEYIGSRTDVLFVNASNSLGMAPSPVDTVKPKCLVCFVSPQGVPNLDLAPFREWVKHCPILMSFGPDMIGLPAPLRSRPLTSGTYALFTLIKMFPVHKLFVTGFTMFGAVPGGSGKYYQDERPGVGVFHDLDQEAQIFVTLLKNFAGELEITEEVRTLAQKHGINLALGQQTTHRGRTVLRHVAAGLAWRCIVFGISLRRFAESQ